jgi:hypothetical protein
MGEARPDEGDVIVDINAVSTVIVVALIVLSLAAMLAAIFFGERD